MARKNLSQHLRGAGLALMHQTDALGMNAQGAMWVYSHLLQDWRFYLVSSIVDTAGRRKAYELLIRAFEVGDFPKEMTVEDVHLGSPDDALFRLVSRIVEVDNGIAEFQNCMFNDVEFDGVVYRSLQHEPTIQETARIEKAFKRKIREKERI